MIHSHEMFYQSRPKVAVARKKQMFGGMTITAKGLKALQPLMPALLIVLPQLTAVKLSFMAANLTTEACLSIYFVTNPAPLPGR